MTGPVGHAGRALGPVVVSGSVRGAIAGIPLSAIALLITREPHLIAAPVFASAVLVACESAAAVLATRGGRAAARAGAGFLYGTVMLSPVFASADAERALPFLVSFTVLVGASLALGEVLAGDPVLHPVPRLRLRRNGFVALCAIFVPVGAFALGGAQAGYVTLLVLLGLLVAAVLACVGDLAGAPLGKWVDAQLDPEWYERSADEARARHDELTAAYRSCLARAVVGDPDEKLLREKALDHALAALEQARAHEAVKDRARADALRAAALLLELGKTEHLDAVVKDLPERDVIKGEAQRIRGGASAALFYAERAPACPEREAARALALADAGDLAGARAALALVPAEHHAFLERLSVAAVRKHLAARSGGA